MGIKEIINWLGEFSKLTAEKNLPESVKVIICPSNPHITLLKETETEMGYVTGAQDFSLEEKGAHTGETGAYQIKELCGFSIVGHSERKEDHDTVVRKRDLALKNKITPIVCFVNPNDAPKFYAKGAFLCWEDPSNISKNGEYREKNPAEIKKGIEEIRKEIPKDAVLIYGGSVNRENIKGLSKIDGIDGVLVGNASLEAGHFVDIINSSI